MPEDIEQEVDVMMANAGSLDLAQPWQAVKYAMGKLDAASQVVFMEALHEALVAQGNPTSSEDF